MDTEKVIDPLKPLPNEPIGPPPPKPIPCVETITIPVPEGTVNLLDPEVIAREVARGEAQNAAEHHLEKDDL